MKKSIWNYLMIGVCFAIIVICFIPFYRNGCCVNGYDGQIHCSYSWDSVLSRFAGCGLTGILVFVLYLLIAGSAMLITIVSDLLKGDRRLIISSIVLTAFTLLCFPPVIIFATISYPTC